MTDDGTDDSRTPSAAATTALALTGTALVLEPVTGGLSLIARLAALAADRIEDAEVRKLLDAHASLEERVEALEASRVPLRRIEGEALDVLVASVLAEANNLNEWASADDVMRERGLSPDEYKKAVEELEALGLVRADPGGNSPSGYSRTRLEPAAFLRVAPGILKDVSVGEEMLRVLETVQDLGGERVLANCVLEKSRVPLPRLDLYVRAGKNLDLLDAGGTGTLPYQNFGYVSLKPLGRRVLRGEDPLPT